MATPIQEGLAASAQFMAPFLEMAERQRIESSPEYKLQKSLALRKAQVGLQQMEQELAQNELQRQAMEMAMSGQMPTEGGTQIAAEVVDPELTRRFEDISSQFEETEAPKIRQTLAGEKEENIKKAIALNKHKYILEQDPDAYMAHVDPVKRQKVGKRVELIKQFNETYGSPPPRYVFDPLVAKMVPNEEFKQYVTARNDFLKSKAGLQPNEFEINEKDLPPLDATGRRPEVLESSEIPNSVKTKVRALSEYKIQWPSRASLSKDPSWNMALDIIQYYDPNWSATDYKARQDLRSEFVKGKAAANIRSLNTAIGHLNALSKSGEKLENWGFKPLNWVKNSLSDMAGYPEVNNFLTKANAVEGELATLFKGTGATDQEIKAWRERINASQSPEQIKGFVQSAVELAKSRAEALASQYYKGMGRTKDFSFLSGEARSILKKFGEDVDSWDPVSAPSASAQETVGDSMESKAPLGSVSVERPRLPSSRVSSKAEPQETGNYSVYTDINQAKAAIQRGETIYFHDKKSGRMQLFAPR